MPEFTYILKRILLIIPPLAASQRGGLNPAPYK